MWENEFVGWIFFKIEHRKRKHTIARLLRARPAHALSHETPAKKINTIFCYLARQRDRPVHFAAVARENIARDNPAKNKNGSRAVFFVAALGKIFLM